MYLEIIPVYGQKRPDEIPYILTLDPGGGKVSPT